MLRGNQPPTGSARFRFKRQPVVLRNGLHRLQQPIGVLLGPAAALTVHQQDAVVATQPNGRRAVAHLDRLAQELHHQRLVDVGRVVVAGRALILLPVIDEGVRVQRRQYVFPINLTGRRGGDHASLEEEGPGRRAPVARLAHRDHVPAVRQSREDESAIGTRDSSFKASIAAGKQHLDIVKCARSPDPGDVAHVNSRAGALSLQRCLPSPVSLPGRPRILSYCPCRCSRSETWARRNRSLLPPMAPAATSATIARRTRRLGIRLVGFTLLHSLSADWEDIEIEPGPSSSA